MPIYVTLMKLTDEGAKNVKEAPARIQEGIKAFEAMGGKVLAFYVTMGEHDYISIGEAPDDETGMAFLAALGSKGNARTTTYKAFTPEEFAKIIKKLP